jgi:hypothetical protein
MPIGSGASRSLVRNEGSKGLELQWSDDVFKRLPEDRIRREPDERENVRADLPHDEVRLGQCEEQSVLLDVADDVNRLLRALVELERAKAVDGPHFSSQPG